MVSFKRYGEFVSRIISAKHPYLAYIGGFLGHHNLGDEALFDAAGSLFYKCSILKFPQKEWFTRVAKILPGIHCSILAGGTIINRLEGWRRLADKYFNIMPFSFVFGTGVAHPSFWSSREEWKNTLKDWKVVLEKCSYVGVRGPMSAQLLTDAGVGNVEVVGDPVLTFATNRPPENASYIPGSIGLNIGQANGAMWGSEANVLTEYVKLAMFARKAGWRVKWFVVWPADLEITEKAAELSGTDRDIYKVYCDFKRYLELVRPLSVFVGLKLHAVALATSAYVPSVMVEYQPKCRDFMQSIGQDAMTVRTDKLKADEVWEIVSTWNSSRQETSQALYHSIKPLWEIQRSKAKQLMDIIGTFSKV